MELERVKAVCYSAFTSLKDWNVTVKMMLMPGVCSSNVC